MFRIPLEYDVRKISVKKEEPLKTELDTLPEGGRIMAECRRPAAMDAVQNLKVCEAALDITEDPWQGDGLN